MTTHRIGTHERGRPAARGAADVLCLAAAPTFAVMALLTAVSGSGPHAMLCADMHGVSPLNGMASMYLLMSAFHAAPWLKLIARRQRNAPSLSPHATRSNP